MAVPIPHVYSITTTTTTGGTISLSLTDPFKVGDLCYYEGPNEYYHNIPMKILAIISGTNNCYVKLLKPICPYGKNINAITVNRDYLTKITGGYKCICESSVLFDKGCGCGGV